VKPGDKSRQELITEAVTLYDKYMSTALESNNTEICNIFKKQCQIELEKIIDNLHFCFKENCAGGIPTDLDSYASLIGLKIAKRVFERNRGDGEEIEEACLKKMVDDQFDLHFNRIRVYKEFMSNRNLPSSKNPEVIPNTGQKTGQSSTRYKHPKVIPNTTIHRTGHNTGQSNTYPTQNETWQK
jgi:hypothetical protein